MPRRTKVIPLIELEEMHTGSLMKRRLNLLKCEESFEASDNDFPSPPPHENGFLQYKNTDEWKQAYRELKSVLSKRENLPNKAERKKIRQTKGRKR